MTRRRRSDSEGGEYDSVLDTMTNVVGILIIVVAVTQLNVSSAVGRAREAMIEAGTLHDHPPVAEAVIAAARDRLAVVVQERALLEEERGQQGASRGSGPRVSEEDWEKLSRQLEQADLGPTEYEVRSRIRALEKKLAAEIEKKKRVDEEIRRTSKRVQELKRQIETLANRKIEAPPPVQARLPDPSSERTAGRRRLNFVVKSGKVYEDDVEGLFKELGDDLKEIVEETPAIALLHDRFYGLLARRWNGRRYQTRNWLLRFRVVSRAGAPQGVDLAVEKVLRSGARGTPLADLARKSSPFGRLIRKESPRKAWLYFQVYEDSFETYLTARGVAEDRDYAVGWSPWGMRDKMEFVVFHSRGGSGPEAD